MDDLTRLLLAARAGDADALDAWVRATQLDVWRFCAYLVDRQAADDLTQETYLRVWRALPTFRAESSVRSWLLSIARRTCADELRRRVRGRRLGDRLTAAPEVETDRTAELALAALIDELEEDQRAAFVLTQLVGLSYAEAAEVCDCPVGTIRSRVARARERLVASYGSAATGGLSG